MSEKETQERIIQVPLQFIKRLPFNTTVISEKERRMLHEEMKRPDGPKKIDPILLRRLTPEEIEQYKDKNPWVKYEIVDGHTRFEIAKQLNWPWIRARIIDATREEAYEINYRKNRERGTVSQLAEAIYFKHLQQDLKMPPWKIGEKFGLGEIEVKKIHSRAVIPRDARRYITSKLSEVGKRLSGKQLEVIASAPREKQLEVAEAVIEGGLKADEAKEAKEAIVKGLPKEEAVKLAKETAKKKRAAAPKPAPKPEKKPEEETGEITCPKCGAKAKVYWHSKKVEWRET